MMSNLFSVFDPSSSFYLPLNWLLSMAGILIIPFIFWLSQNRLGKMIYLITNTLHNEFKVLVGTNRSLGHTFIFISLFMLLVLNNSMGLLPYVFTSTSHLVVTLSLAFPLWLSFMIYGWSNHYLHMFSHLVPLGTPTALMPFMVLIETISNIIRPGTLAVRLAANMIAGHLLLVLLGNQGPAASSSIVMVLILVQILLLTLEAAVAIIQSYVFAVLSSLYSSEVN